MSRKCLWSILIAAIPERYHLMQPLLFSLLETQHVSRMSDVELVVFLDNKRRSVGEKRNALLDIANGEYISMIDDDDEVSPDYVRRVHDSLQQAKRTGKMPDVVCFGQRATLVQQGITHECTYSLACWRDRKPEERRQLAPAYDEKGATLPNVLLWTGPPSHTMAWRRDVIGDARFPETQFGEDVAWVDAVCERAKGEMQLGGAPLYFYKFDSERSATR